MVRPYGQKIIFREMQEYDALYLNMVYHGRLQRRHHSEQYNYRTCVNSSHSTSSPDWVFRRLPTPSSSSRRVPSTLWKDLRQQATPP